MNKKILISTGGSGGHVIPATIYMNIYQKSILMYSISTDLRGVKF